MKRQRAQSFVEFGIVFPAFLLIVVAIVDLGHAVWAYNTVSYLAREGARRAEVVTDNAAVANFTHDRCQALLRTTCYAVTPSVSVPSVTPSPLPSGDARIDVTPGTCPSITVTQNFQPLTTMILGTNLTLAATSKSGACT
jgi:Flp pilus assembly protein TadG